MEWRVKKGLFTREDVPWGLSIQVYKHIISELNINGFTYKYVVFRLSILLVTNTPSEHPREMLLLEWKF